MSKSFYEEFQRNDFFEKEASENQNVRNTLSGLNPEVLDKIASELDAISAIEDDSLESKLAAENEEDNEPSEKVWWEFHLGTASAYGPYQKAFEIIVQEAL